MEEIGTGEKEINGESESKEENTLLHNTNISVQVITIDPQAKQLFIRIAINT